MESASIFYAHVSRAFEVLRARAANPHLGRRERARYTPSGASPTPLAGIVAAAGAGESIVDAPPP